MTTQSDLPLAAASAPAHERDLVLAVDDNEQNLAILADYLTSWGYDVAMARDGREALGLYPRTNPSIIVLDVMMPNMDGYEACARIKGEAGGRMIPILMLTALTDTDRSEERRVGKECRIRWSPYHLKKKKKPRSSTQRPLHPHLTCRSSRKTLGPP